MSTALITGITGQDGAYLARYLLTQGYHVIGAERRNTGQSHWRLKKLKVEDDIEFVDFELLEYENMRNRVRTLYPDEIYNLAAQSFVQLSFDQPIYTNEVNYLGVLRLLECADPDVKIYQASTSEMYGSTPPPQSEDSPFAPRSPYAVAKLAAYWACVNYREAYDRFICNGILFNHESPLRGDEFVTQKIVKGLVEVSKKKREYIELGNLDAKRDWGHANDYVKAMHLMMQQFGPDDYVVATGEMHTVREFAQIVCDKLALDFDQVIQINEKYKRPAEVDELCGDNSKIKSIGWKPEYTFNALIEEMVNDAYHDSDIYRL